MKLKPTDGLGPREIQKIRSAVRQVWQRSKARALVVRRCALPGGYARCEECSKKVPKIFVDHIEACGDVLDGGYIARMFVPSSLLRGLCHECHKKKTKLERAEAKRQEVASYDLGF